MTRSAPLFDTRWLELPPRPIDQKIFQDKPPLPAKWVGCGDGSSMLISSGMAVDFRS